MNSTDMARTMTSNVLNDCLHTAAGRRNRIDSLRVEAAKEHILTRWSLLIWASYHTIDDGRYSSRLAEPGGIKHPNHYLTAA